MPYDPSLGVAGAPAGGSIAGAATPRRAFRWSDAAALRSGPLGRLRQRAQP